MQDAAYVRDAFARIADRYVLTNHVLSCGADIWWRKVVTARIRKWKPARLLDVASGTGDLALEIQDQCPDCEVIASDFCAEMLAHAASRGNGRTLVADALNLPFPDGSFDVVTVAFGLRNMADYPAALREMQPRARPGGHLVILDFSLPGGFRGPTDSISTTCCRAWPAGSPASGTPTNTSAARSRPFRRAGHAGFVGNLWFAETSATPLTFGVVSSIRPAARTRESVPTMPARDAALELPGAHRCRA
jgi:demethylmenaquinone methyltransferase / 2-methoxy-6-polyprenyl-1,4-benzoquinol methylase